jgi:hypothetical protein
VDVRDHTTTSNGCLQEGHAHAGKGSKHMLMMGTPYRTVNLTHVPSIHMHVLQSSARCPVQVLSKPCQKHT